MGPADETMSIMLPINVHCKMTQVFRPQHIPLHKPRPRGEEGSPLRKPPRGQPSRFWRPSRRSLPVARLSHKPNAEGVVDVDDLLEEKLACKGYICSGLGSPMVIASEYRKRVSRVKRALCHYPDDHGEFFRPQQSISFETSSRRSAGVLA